MGVSLFSAYAEVFPFCLPSHTPAIAFLCLRRGVSGARVLFTVNGDFSLPTQRCFLIRLLDFFRAHLFSAYAEVFPDGSVCRGWWDAFLCLRRGVSD